MRGLHHRVQFAEDHREATDRPVELVVTMVTNGDPWVTNVEPMILSFW